ncbi:MAG: hypothetical protein OXE92_06600 [Bacteroidetes bacterium]|nr:hypothetical protein [Bacteroidota bacterium]
MKYRLVVTFTALAVTIFFSHILVAQHDSLEVNYEVDFSLEGDTLIIKEDTLIITYPGYGDWRNEERHMNIEREIIVKPDMDSMIVMDLRQHPRMKIRVRSHEERKIPRLLRDRSRNHGHDGHRKGHRIVTVHGDSQELRKMESEARKLAREVRRADEDSYDEKKAMLRAQLEKIFDYKQAMKIKEMEQKRSELEERSKVMQERQKNREAIIGDRVNQLLGRGSLYRW